MKELVKFCKSDTKLRLVIATSAFGLGVDCPDIGQVINFGAPNTTKELIQQSGRAGQDRNNVKLYFVTRMLASTLQQQWTGTEQTRLKDVIIKFTVLP